MRNDEHVNLPVGFMRDLAVSTSQREILAATAQWMPRLITCQRSSIALPFGESQLQIHALSGSLIIPQGSLLPLASSIVGRAYSSQAIVTIADITDTDWDETAALTAAGVRSVMVCPIIVDGRSLGTVNLGNEEIGPFTLHDELVMGSIVHLIASFLGVHELVVAEQHRANTDHLTHLLSRRGILDHLERLFDVTDHRLRPSLLYLDLDRFKVINDAHGHLVGDEVLRELAGRVGGSVRDCDRVGRLGGDEFLVVVAKDSGGCVAREIAARIEQACTTSIEIGSISITPRISIGLASAEGPGSSADDVLLDADQALYIAKRSSRCLAVADQETRARSVMIAAIDKDLDRGLDSGEITYHYQPIRDLRTRELLGAEALIRWTHPTLGVIPAPLLIERLETTGRTEALTRWSLATVARQLVTVRNLFPWFHDKAMSVNMSPRQLAWDGYVALHLETLELHGLRPQDIIIEVVESVGVDAGDAAEATLKTLGAHDIVIALDDFGTGHNALRYFTMFPIHAMKLDRSLVSLVVDNEISQTILASLAALFNDLGAAALAEGIETEAEAAICERLGITHGQGWHLGKPMALDAFMTILATEGPPLRDPSRTEPSGAPDTLQSGQARHSSDQAERSASPTVVE